jgi:hypothetical protein
LIRRIATALGVRELVLGLREDRYSEYFITMVKAFVDDSGSGGDSPWYVLAGYVGTVADWLGFEAEWAAVLDRPPLIKYFKGAEAESLKNQFDGFTRDQANAKIDALIEVIGHHAQRAIIVRTRQKNYNEIIKPKVPEIWDDAYHFLFPYFISAVLNMETYAGAGEPAEFVFDSSQRLDKRAQVQYTQLLQMPQYAGRMANVLFRDEKLFLPLQAADLLAWQVRRAYCVRTEPRRPHFDNAVNCPQQKPFSAILDREKLQACLKAMEANAIKEAALLGIPVEVLKQYLFKRKPRKGKPRDQPEEVR